MRKAARFVEKMVFNSVRPKAALCSRSQDPGTEWETRKTDYFVGTLSPWYFILLIVYKIILLLPSIYKHLLSPQRNGEHKVIFNPSFSNRPKEFIECVSHIRLLSWLLLGSLTHNAVCPNASSPCLPIPLDAGSHIADHLIVILIGFPEQSKVSDFCKPNTICIEIANRNPYQPIMFLLRRKCILSLGLLWIFGKQLCANALFKVV